MTRQEPLTIMFVHGITEIGGAERELLLILDRLSDLGTAPWSSALNGDPCTMSYATERLRR